MILPVFVVPLTTSPLSPGDRLLTALLWFLCLLPAWLYLGKPPSRREPIPFLPFIGVEYALYYALQGVLGRINVYGRFELSRLGYALEPEMFTGPILMALGGWCLLLCGYYLVGFLVGNGSARSIEISRPDDLARWGFRVFFAGLAIEVVQRLTGNPMIIRGLLYFGGTLTLSALALLTVLAVRKQLSTRQRQLLVISGIAMFFLRAGTSATAQLAIIVLTVLFSVWIGGGRIAARWIWGGLIAAMMFIAIRGVANEHRKSELFLSEDATLLDRSALLFELVGERIEREGIGATLAGGWESVAGRSALLDLFTDVVRQTPETVPYWGGDTYLSLVGVAVPRFLWPDKPVKLTGYAFGQRYHYLPPGNFSTTINLPYLVEFYANFGETAVYIGMLLVGMLYRGVERVVNVPGQPILQTVLGLGLLMPLINIESDFSLVFGGLILTGGALYATYRLARSVGLIRKTRVRRALDFGPTVFDGSNPPGGSAPAMSRARTR